MNYGLYLPNFGAFGDARLLGELAREAEQAGWMVFSFGITSPGHGLRLWSIPG
jgi:hypothetical protein